MLVLSIVLLFPLKGVYAQKTKHTLSKEQIWFEEKKWLENVEASPDTSIDTMTFAHHYKKHSEKWKKVFKFLRENDLMLLPLGKQALGDYVTVNIQEYTTREPGNEQMEGHRKYIDLQYNCWGCELQGYAKLQAATQIINYYNEKKDVTHHRAPMIQYHVIKPNWFTIFFPDDIHITNIQYGGKG